MDLINRAKELVETINNATPGPWAVGDRGQSVGYCSTEDDQSYGMVIPIVFGDRTYDDQWKFDADAIVAARNDAPEIITGLVERVEMLEKALKPLTSEFMNVKATGSGSIIITSGTVFYGNEVYVGSVPEYPELARYLREKEAGE